MRAHSPARPPHRHRGRALLLWALVTVLLGTGGCARRESRGSALSFEELTDTTGLTRGAPILTSFEPYRLGGGAMRLRGTADLPDGTRLQVTVVRAATGEIMTVVQLTVLNGSFETAPLMDERGPFPPDRYRFDLLAHFNSAWQPDRVLRATRDGRSLKGPGMTRGAGGQPALFLREERRL